MHRLLFLIVGLIIGALIVWKLAIPAYKGKKRVMLAIWEILACGFFYVAIVGPNAAKTTQTTSATAKKASEKKAAEAKKESEQKAKEAKKKSEAKKAKSSSKKSAKKSKKKSKSSSINDKLAKELYTDQGFANGTLDENGKPVAGGQKNDDFAWANYINSMKWSKGDNLSIYLMSVSDLSQSELNQVARRAQSAASSVLYAEGKINSDDLSSGVPTTFYIGSNPVGHSRFTNSHSFKWNKNALKETN